MSVPNGRTVDAPNGRALGALLAKEWRELLTSRAALLFGAALGPLVGHAFVTAVRAYAEMSGAAGGPAALSQGISPLDGIVVPTFGAYALAASLLFPFVVIRLVSAEQESGALRLALQAPVALGVQLAAKGLVLVAAWLLAWTPGLVALVMWTSYGGHLAAPETFTVLLGHLLRGAIVIGIGTLAAAVADGAASAAVVALALTLGGWALDFAAQVNGGVLQQVARFTPDAALRVFERGELRLDVAVIVVIVTIALVALAAQWLHPGQRLRRRVLRSTVTTIAAIALVAAGTSLRTSVDASEDRRNSFPVADEHALSTISVPLHVMVHLAPEDPRLADLQRGVLRKLQRAMRRVEINYAASTSTGLFEGDRAHYGEIWYAMGAKRALQRSTIERVVLESVYGLAEIAPPAVTDEASAYRGWPLRATPAGAAWFFYFAWPLLVVVAWWWRRR